MAQTGLHTIIPFKIFKNNYNNYFLYAFLMGSIIPDFDVAINSIYKIFKSWGNPNSYYLNKNYLINYDLNVFHSIISSIIIYLIILIFYEIKKNTSILSFANGFLLGLLTHIIIDIFLFLRPVQIFWPLNYAGLNPINIWGEINIPFKVMTTYLTIEFIFFRYIGYELIKILIIQKDKNSKYISALSRWMKIQALLFILFIFYFNIFEITYSTFIFYNLCLSFSITYCIIILYILRFTIIDYLDFKNKKSTDENKTILKATPIDNLG